jgi:hypothetical protein
VGIIDGLIFVVDGGTSEFEEADFLNSVSLDMETVGVGERFNLVD